MSETACNTTLAEGVALCRKVEKTGLVYMLAENYPYMLFNQEMRRLYQAGRVGTQELRRFQIDSLAGSQPRRGRAVRVR